MASSALAIFDLDNTLLDGDCEMLWSRFLRDNHIVDDRFMQLIDRFYQDYELGKLDIYEYEAFLLYPLRYMPTARLLRLRREFVAQIQPLFRSRLVARAERHRSEGDKVLLITATNHLLIEAVAGYLGFSEVICTRVEQITPSLTWRIKGMPAFREGKVQLLHAWLAENQKSLEGSWGYSDSHNDIPLLSLVDHPVAVTPDETLWPYAAQRDWEIVTLLADGDQ